MLNRYLGRALCVFGVLLSVIPASLATIQVYLDGNILPLTTPPQVIQDTTLVPMRSVFEALGAQVYWYEPTQTITATKGNTVVLLAIGNTSATVNGTPRQLSVPAMRLHDVTMVPLRFVSETLGNSVTWDEPTQCIYITGNASAMGNPPATGNAVIPEQPEQPVPMFTSDELDRLLGPFALYPDPLLAQILPASTFPDQVAAAADYRRNGYRDIDDQNWDVSVKAVAYYPGPVLYKMADNPYRTTAIGQAYVRQPDDVMYAVQRLRHRARELGYLYSNRYQQCDDIDGRIRIEPVEARYIYVPDYDPQVVYVRRGSVIAYRNQLTIGVWLNRDMDWHTQKVYYHGWKGNGWVSRSRPQVNVVNVTYVNKVYVNKTVVVNVNVTHYDIKKYRNDVRSNDMKHALPVENARQRPIQLPASLFRKEKVSPVHHESKPIVHNEPKPIIHNEPKPIVHNEPKPPVHTDYQPTVHGDTKPPVHGDYQPTVHGDTKPPVHGDSQPTVHGDTKPPVHGGYQPTVHGDTPIHTEPAVHSNPQTEKKPIEQKPVDTPKVNPNGHYTPNGSKSGGDTPVIDTNKNNTKGGNTTGKTSTDSTKTPDKGTSKTEKDKKDDGTREPLVKDSK